MCDLISDVSCCVDLKPEKETKFENKRHFYINLHLLDGLGIEFTAF